VLEYPNGGRRVARRGVRGDSEVSLGMRRRPPSEQRLRSTSWARVPNGLTSRQRRSRLRQHGESVPRRSLEVAAGRSPAIVGSSFYPLFAGGEPGPDYRLYEITTPLGVDVPLQSPGPRRLSLGCPPWIRIDSPVPRRKTRAR